MFYIINKIIKYTPAAKELSLQGESENSIVLSNQASRLLMELIKNSGTCLSREYMLRHVWEDFGLTPSNNNLYAAVSEIRKAFSALGITEKVIITIPKTGFKFNCSIETLESDIEEKIKAKKTIKYKILALISLAAIVLFFSLYAMTKSNQINIKNEKITLVGKVDKCTIYSLDVPFLQGKEKIIAAVVNDTKFGELCEKTVYDVFFSDLGEVGGRMYISGCYKISENEYTACKNMRNFSR